MRKREYTITLRYYARPTTLSVGGDTNDIMANYYGLYLYASLTHAAIWAKDNDSAQTYNAAYSNELERAKMADVKGRFRGPFPKKAAVLP